MLSSVRRRGSLYPIPVSSFQTYPSDAFEKASYPPTYLITTGFASPGPISGNLGLGQLEERGLNNPSPKGAHSARERERVLLSMQYDVQARIHHGNAPVTLSASISVHNGGRNPRQNKGSLFSDGAIRETIKEGWVNLERERVALPIFVVSREYHTAG